MAPLSTVSGTMIAMGLLWLVKEKLMIPQKPLEGPHSPLCMVFARGLVEQTPQDFAAESAPLLYELVWYAL